MFNIRFKQIASSSAGNFYLLHGYKTKIMIECGIKPAQIGEAIKHAYSDYSACLVTHRHKDHCASIEHVAKMGVQVYCNDDVRDSHNYHHNIKSIYSTTKIGEFTVTPFAVEHDVDNYGYMIDSDLSGERLVFLIDTFYSPVTFSGVTHWVIEANHCSSKLKENIENSDNNAHLNRLYNSHMSIDRCIKTIEANDTTKIKEIHLTHISRGNGDINLFKSRIFDRFGINAKTIGDYED